MTLRSLPVLIVIVLLSACSLAGGLTVARAGSTSTARSGPLRVATAGVPSPPPSDRLAESAIEQAAPSVVLVKTDQGLGSGVIVASNGYIVTNNHVVSGAHRVTVTFANGKSMKAQVKGTDPLDDLAVIKVNTGGLPAATFADTSKLEVGQTVLAVGNPLGITRTVTEGIISALGRTVSEGKGGGRLSNAIQTSAQINPGNSGGALINLAGQVVGIPTLSAVDPEFGSPAQGIGFAIPASKVVSIATQVIQTGKVSHTGQAALGIQAATVTTQVAQRYGLPVYHGVLVAGTTNHGPAAKAGLRAGDIIVRVGSHAINTNSDLLNVLSTHRPGDSVTVAYVTEGGKRKTAHVKLGELPANATG